MGRGIPYSARFSLAYGVLIDTNQSNPDLERVGSAERAQMAEVHEMCVQGTMRVVNGVGTIKRFNRTNGLLYEDGSPSVLDGSAGNIVSYMPPFYYNVEVLDATHYRVWVSKYPIQGFRKHPGWCVGTTKAVVNNTAIFGKPENSLWSVVNPAPEFRGGNNDATNDALQKGFLGKPRTVVNRTNFYAYAQNQGSQFGLVDYTWHNAMQMLFITKYATLNSQKPVSAKIGGYFAGGLGNGVTNVIGTDWSNYNGYYPLVPTGQTIGRGLQDGEVDYTINGIVGGTGDLIVKPNTFMGVENPFGDIWEWTQGINIWKQTIEEGDKFLAYIYDNGVYEDAITDKWTRSFEFQKIEGWLRRIIAGEHFDTIAAEVANGASSSTYFADFFYNNLTTGFRGLQRSGYAYYGSFAGLSCAHSGFAASYAYVYIGSRLGFYGSVQTTI